MPRGPAAADDCSSRNIHVGMFSLQPQDTFVAGVQRNSGPMTKAAFALTIDGAFSLFAAFNSLYKFVLVQLLLAVANDLENEI